MDVKAVGVVGILVHLCTHVGEPAAIVVDFSQDIDVACVVGLALYLVDSGLHGVGLGVELNEYVIHTCVSDIDEIVALGPAGAPVAILHHLELDIAGLELNTLLAPVINARVALAHDVGFGGRIPFLSKECCRSTSHNVEVVGGLVQLGFAVDFLGLLVEGDGHGVVAVLGNVVGVVLAGICHAPIVVLNDLEEEFARGEVHTLPVESVEAVGQRHVVVGVGFAPCGAKQRLVVTSHGIGVGTEIGNLLDQDNGTINRLGRSIKGDQHIVVTLDAYSLDVVAGGVGDVPTVVGDNLELEISR